MENIFWHMQEHRRDPSNVTEVTVPKGTTIYEGTTAPQGNLLNGGNQIYI